jgi:hypothetical protein
MKVYILVCSPYHDNCTLHGVYATLEAAMADCPRKDKRCSWALDGFYVREWKNVVAEQGDFNKMRDEDWLVFEFPIKGVEGVEKTPRRRLRGVGHCGECKSRTYTMLGQLSHKPGCKRATVHASATPDGDNDAHT